MTNKEILEKLNYYVAKVNAELMGKPDEVTGCHKYGSLLDDFVMNRSQFNVFESFINLSGCAAIDRQENLTESLVIERAIWACQQMSDLLKQYMDKLAAMQEEEL